MYRVVLVCALGYSTSMLRERMKKAAFERGIPLEVEAMAQSELEETDCLEDVDALVLGPQIKHSQAGLAARFRIPVLVAAAEDYGLMNGEKILSEVLAVIEGEVK